MGPESDRQTSQPEAGDRQETLFSEMHFTIPEFIDYARNIGSDELAEEFEAYRRWSENYGAQVRVLVPNEENKSPTYEIIFSADEII